MRNISSSKFFLTTGIILLLLGFIFQIISIYSNIRVSGWLSGSVGSGIGIAFIGVAFFIVGLIDFALSGYRNPNQNNQFSVKKYVIITIILFVLNFLILLVGAGASFHD